MNHPLTTNMHPVMAAALSPALFAQDAIAGASARSMAIADADAHLNNAGLPTYTETLALLRRIVTPKLLAQLNDGTDEGAELVSLYRAITTGSPRTA